jgi:N6-adenosine-specific RNA methylase IME4
MIEIEQQALFDYGTLDTDTRVFVQEKAQSIHTRLKRTAEDIIAIGQDLISVKNRLPYGQFGKWLQSEFDMTQQMAINFMRVAERINLDTFKNILKLPVSVLYVLVAPSTPDNIIEMVELGQIAPTIPAIREAKRELAQPVSSEPQTPLRFDEEDDYTPVSTPTVPFTDDVVALDAWEDDIPTIEPEDRPMPPVAPVLDPVREITEESFEQYKARMEKRQQKEQEREQRRDVNRQLIAESKSIDEALGTAKFSTIVIDPPWDWGDEGDVDQFGRATPLYGTMSLEQLLEMPVGNYADTDSHIYLWITNRSLPKGFQLLERWGFRYVTCVTWVKPHFGMGNYFRGQTEHLLFGVKGSQALKRHNAGTYFSEEDKGAYFEAPRGPKGHSSKPLVAYDLIESCSPGPYLELFARSDRPDWTSWGAEV